MQGPEAWPADPDWQRGQSRPDHVNLRFYVQALFTLSYLALLAALTLAHRTEVTAALTRLWQAEPLVLDPLLLLPGLLLIGLCALPGLVRAFLRWRWQRGLRLMLDPVPAVPGGELGGRLTLPLPNATGFRVTLSCLQRVVGRGRERRLRDELLWQVPAATRTWPALNGTRLEFCAALAAEQPDTSFVEGRREIWWAVHVQLPAQSLDLVFPVPVSSTGRQRQSAYAFSAREQHQAAAAAPPVRGWQLVQDSPEAIRVEFPSGRSGKAARILSLVGLIFSAVALFLGDQLVAELQSVRVSYFAVLVQSMILLGFGLFGPALLLAGLYLGRNRLTLIADGRQLVTRRHCCGFSRQQRIALDQVEGLAERVVGRVGQGVAAELEYAIDAYLRDGRRLRLADGIQGQAALTPLLQRLRQVSGIQQRPDPAQYRLQRAAPPGWVRGLPSLFKLLGWLMFGLTLAALLADLR